MLAWISSIFPSLMDSHLLDFMSKGGAVLWWLAAVVCLCWILIIERILFLTLSYRHLKASWVAQWKQRSEHDSWYALAQKEGMLQQAHVMLTKHLDFIKALVALCPMLGLLGTVTGMITVFDLMALSGSSDPKLMASGISMATLPTMAGMVAALAGMFAHSRLVKVATRKELHLEQQLRSGE
ncbi:MAG: MotA/TolQ/ExbB proton channel family protein [Vibrio sp.]